MKSISVSAVVILVLVAIAAFAQRPQDIFGNTELGPNGYIGFYGLPTPPSRSAGDTPSAPHTTRLPKKGASARQSANAPSLQTSRKWALQAAILPTSIATWVGYWLRTTCDVGTRQHREGALPE